jgi:hypothetical protein
MRVSPQAGMPGEDGDERRLLPQMHDIESEDESITRERIIYWYRELQVNVRNMEKENEELRREVGELRERAACETIEMLGRAQVQYYERDERMYRRINALVLDKIFPFKKFIISQRDPDDFTGNTSLGMVVMNMLKVEMLDQLPFWNVYKEIVADAIANRQTTITNNLKKVVMSKYSKKITVYGLLWDKIFLTTFYLLVVIRDQSRQQGTTQPGTGSSNSHATAYTGRDPQATKSTQLEQQHGIHIRRGAPCWSSTRSMEVEDHKVLCPPGQAHVSIGQGIHASCT